MKSETSLFPRSKSDPLHNEQCRQKSILWSQPYLHLFNPVMISGTKHLVVLIVKIFTATVVLRAYREVCYAFISCFKHTYFISSPLPKSHQGIYVHTGLLSFHWTSLFGEEGDLIC